MSKPLSEEDMAFCEVHNQKYLASIPVCPVCFGEAVLDDADLCKQLGLLTYAEKAEKVSVTYNRVERMVIPEIEEPVRRITIDEPVIRRERL